MDCKRKNRQLTAKLSLCTYKISTNTDEEPGPAEIADNELQANGRDRVDKDTGGRHYPIVYVVVGGAKCYEHCGCHQNVEHIRTPAQSSAEVSVKEKKDPTSTLRVPSPTALAILIFQVL